MTSNRSPNIKSKKDWTASSLSPISKLLANRPTVVQSLVSKVEAISFDGLSHQPHQSNQIDSKSKARPSSFQSQSSPSTSLTTSPNLNEFSAHLEEYTRETPTIRHLKTSLRSRLQSDSDRHQKRFSEDSARSDLTDYPTPTPHSSPHKFTPASLNPSQITSHRPSHTKSTPSSSSKNRLVPSSDSLSPPQPTLELSSPDRSSSNQTDSQDYSPPTNLSNKSSPEKVNTSSSHPGLTVNQEGCGSDPTPTEHPIQPKPSTDRSSSSANLPDLRIPLINFNLSPPPLALWSIEAYESKGETDFADIIAHLIMLPLHTALAITKKLPVAGRYLDLNPLFYQVEKDKQGILLTASQIAMGLILASGWKVARRILR